jgi:DEAD/DEAH box helicase domain-containing protein
LRPPGRRLRELAQSGHHLPAGSLRRLGREKGCCLWLLRRKPAAQHSHRRKGKTKTMDQPSNAITDLAGQAGFEVVDTLTLPPRKGCLREVPEVLDLRVAALLKRKYPKGLFSHQAEAIQLAITGNDVCLATATASGKSDVYIAAAAHLLINDSQAKVLAIYPARALIQDQIGKWEGFLEELGLRVGYIDGGVSVKRRGEILENNDVVLMTPDVAHAWLMSHLNEREISEFMQALALVVLDEAHVYEGVFGTNMAYFLRRFAAVASRHRLICSTATLGRPADFMKQLTGRDVQPLGQEEDGSPSPQKEIILCHSRATKDFEGLVTLLALLSRKEEGCFLAFADSRRLVEQLVAALHRPSKADDGDDSETNDDTGTAPPRGKSLADQLVLPYRAGYEDEDRKEIQRALKRGRLRGVVSTSALELGLDIGEIDLVVMLSLPPTVKAFWQRLGRAGRQNPGVCLLVDNRGALVGRPQPLEPYLRRELEPSWLYMENRYIQYSNALCAAYEIAGIGDLDHRRSKWFESLPNTFLRFLENEINPTEVVPADLYPLKQRAQAGPHREFPIRSGIEPDFDAKTPQGIGLGNLTFSQALREAYPGAIYYYMARPYRVYRFDYRKGEISARREKHWTTRPRSQTMVFPRFEGAFLQFFRSDTGFLAETEMQVSERVVGFTEQRGSAKPEEHLYGPASLYYRREINRFFETTGVCWYFPDKAVVGERTAQLIAEGFCTEFGVQDRDLGFGIFTAMQSPLGGGRCKGACVYDATNGSLRLTQRLAERFLKVIPTAITIAQTREEVEAVRQLRLLERAAADLRPATAEQQSAGPSQADGDWVVVIAANQEAIYQSQDGPITVTVKGHRYTPHGLMYELASPSPDGKWLIADSALIPMEGSTMRILANLVTGETKPIT